MANHKRKRPKHQRSGCLMCKPHKDERGKQVERVSVRRAKERFSLHDGTTNHNSQFPNRE